jgi:cytochrome c-type biogenesis protein CcmH
MSGGAVLRRGAAAGALALAVLAAVPGGTFAAADPVLEQALPDPAAEARAMTLAREIRCVVCENEPVSNSSAEIAVDMRNAIRARVAEGKSDDEVRAYFASRYGEFVLLRPRLSGATLALWAAPFALLLVAGGFVLLRARRRGPVLAAATPGPGAAGTREPDPDEAAARDALARLTADPARPA